MGHVVPRMITRRQGLKKYYLTAVVWEEEGQYVSHCPELGVASCGQDAESAIEALQEAVGLYLENARRLRMLSELRPALKSRRKLTTSLEVAV